MNKSPHQHTHTQGSCDCSHW